MDLDQALDVLKDTAVGFGGSKTQEFRLAVQEVEDALHQDAGMALWEIVDRLREEVEKKQACMDEALDEMATWRGRAEVERLKAVKTESDLYVTKQETERLQATLLKAEGTMRDALHSSEVWQGRAETNMADATTVKEVLQTLRDRMTRAEKTLLDHGFGFYTAVNGIGTWQPPVAADLDAKIAALEQAVSERSDERDKLQFTLDRIRIAEQGTADRLWVCDGCGHGVSQVATGTISAPLCEECAHEGKGGRLSWWMRSETDEEYNLRLQRAIVQSAKRMKELRTMDAWSEARIAGLEEELTKRDAAVSVVDTLDSRPRLVVSRSVADALATSIRANLKLASRVTGGKRTDVWVSLVDVPKILTAVETYERDRGSS